MPDAFFVGHGDRHLAIGGGVIFIDRFDKERSGFIGKGLASAGDRISRLRIFGQLFTVSACGPGKIKAGDRDFDMCTVFTVKLYRSDLPIKEADDTPNPRYSSLFQYLTLCLHS